MHTIAEFKKLSKPKMVVAITELMVQQGWDIMSWMYNFRSHKREELIKKYQFHLDYLEKQK